MDVKSVADAADEHAWDRTLVLLNLDPSLSMQEVLHQASQYGRVVNFLVPTMIVNEDLPTEEQLIEALQHERVDNPVRITVYDLERNTIEKRYWPSEEDFLQFNKSTSPLLSDQL